MVALKAHPNALYMNAALRAARMHRGHTWPNPSVGCVLVKDGKTIATGSTQSGGRPHAEMEALKAAGDSARGAVAYVTLEPCCHAHDDKPVSCCDALIASGVARVVIGMPDPDPRMMGASIQKLRAAGIIVDVGFGIEAVQHHHIGHHTRIAWNRPRLTLKLAHSRDEKIGLPDQRVAISGDKSWQRTFIQRSKVDAVMIGINTALTDDPQLTNRAVIPSGSEESQGDSSPVVRNDKNISRLQPLRIVIDTHARLPLSAKLATKDTWLLCAQGATTEPLERVGVRAIPCPTINDHIDMNAALHMLGQIGLTHILCEGGATLAQNLLDNKLVDEALIIEGTMDIGANGIPMPPIDLVLREENQIGHDTWRIYDSQQVLDLTKDFLSKI